MFAPAVEITTALM